MEPSKSRNFFKVFLNVGGVIVALAILGYFLLFSPRLSSVQRIIAIRNRYATQVFNLREWLGLPQKVDCGVHGIPVRTLKTTTERGYRYFHSVKGVLVGVDPTLQNLRLKCEGGTEYSVHVSISSMIDPEWFVVSGAVFREGGAVNTEMYFYPAELGRSRERDMGYKDNDIYTVVWADKRDLVEVLESINGDASASLNIDSAGVMGVLR